MSILYARATDPRQYDFDDVFWDKEVGTSSPTRKLFWEYLENSGSWRDSTILDVGCGTGWLIELLYSKGARHVDGIDSSKKNVKISRKHFPHLTIHCSDINSYKTRKRYDMLVSVMVFGHIADIKTTFDKMSSLLKKDGELHIIIPDYDYYTSTDHAHPITIEKLNKDEFVVEVLRPQGRIADIARKTENYISTAKNCGLKPIKDVRIYPTESLIKSVPRYARFRHTVLAHLLIFKK